MELLDPTRHQRPQRPRGRRLLTVLTAGLTILAAACGTGGSSAPTDAGASAPDTSTTTGGATAADAPTSDAQVEVGIAIIGQVGPVLSVVDGFKGALADNGYVEGDNVTFTDGDAQTDSAVVPLMVKQMVQEEPDLIFAAGTPVVLALQQETQDIPVVFGGMTDPVGGGVAASNEEPGGNFTGTSDFMEPSLVLDLLAAAVPDATTVGFIGNVGEQNTAVQLEAFEEVAPDYGLEFQVAPIASSSDLQPAVQSLAGRVDAVILPQDNTVGSAYESISRELVDAGIPIIATSVDRVADGHALVGVGVDYSALGYLAGEQAAQILDGDGDPATMPVIHANSPDGGGLNVLANTAVADLFGLELSDELLGTAEVHDSSPLTGN